MSRLKKLVLATHKPDKKKEMKAAFGRQGLIVLSLDNLIGPEFMAKVVQGFKREELRVTDFMTPKDKLKAFDYSDVANSTIGNLIEALKERGQQHCLVIDRDTHKIRGLISASDIARKLKLSININSESSFSNIFNVLYA